MPRFQEYEKYYTGKEIQAEVFSYALIGETGEERNAGKRELEKIIDEDFPNSELYPNLRCMENEFGTYFKITVEQDQTSPSGEELINSNTLKL